MKYRLVLQEGLDAKFLTIKFSDPKQLYVVYTKICSKRSSNQRPTTSSKIYEREEKIHLQ